MNFQISHCYVVSGAPAAVATQATGETRYPELRSPIKKVSSAQACADAGQPQVRMFVSRG